MDEFRVLEAERPGAVEEARRAEAEVVAGDCLETAEGGGSCWPRNVSEAVASIDRHHAEAEAAADDPRFEAG